jgi:hypothetical protein
MAATAFAVQVQQAGAELIFRPDLDQVIDLNQIITLSIPVAVLLDLNSDGPVDGMIIFDKELGSDPNAFDVIRFEGLFHLLDVSAAASAGMNLAGYMPGDFAAILTGTLSTGGTGVAGPAEVQTQSFDPGFFFAMQFNDAGGDTHVGYGRIEFDAIANTVSLTNFAYESVQGVPALIAELAGDLNGDGFVGIADLNIVLSNWNLTVPPADMAADRDSDGFIGIADLNTVLGNWNNGTPPAAGSGAVPEPASLALLAAGAAGALSGRRHANHRR